MALAILYVGLQPGLVRLPGRWPLLAVAAAAVTAVPTMLLLDRGMIDKTMYAYQLPMSLACTLLFAVVVLPDRAARPVPAWWPVEQSAAGGGGLGFLQPVLVA